MTSVEHDPVEAGRDLAQLDGLSALRAMIAGELPAPPIATLLGFDLVEVDEGACGLRSRARRPALKGASPLTAYGLTPG